MDKGRAFLIVSVIKHAQEEELLPQVKAMIQSFKVIRPAGEETRKKKPEGGDESKGAGEYVVHAIPFRP